MSLFWFEDEKKKLDMLRQYAPSIYVMHCGKKIREINQALHGLRVDYRILERKETKTDDDLKKMKEITEQEQRLNERLELYQMVS